MKKWLRNFCSLVAIVTATIGFGELSASASDEDLFVTDEAKLKSTVQSQIMDITPSFTIGYDETNQGFESPESVENLITNAIDDMALNEAYHYLLIKDWQMSSGLGEYDKRMVQVDVSYTSSKVNEDAVNKFVKSSTSKITNLMTELAKVKQVQDVVVTHGERSVKTKQGSKLSSTFVLEKKGDSHAYALTMYQLLKAAKIEVVYVVGTKKKVPYAWNMVKVDGEWYHLDTAANDTLPNKKGLTDYTHFLLADSQISKEYKWEKANYHVAKSTKYKAFHTMTGAYTRTNNIFYLDSADKKYYKYNFKNAKRATSNSKSYNKNVPK